MPNTTIRIEGGLLATPAPRDNGVRCFKGVPYAAAPVGELRWRAPHPVADWSGVRSADAFGRNSIQGVVFADIDPTVPGVSEDCLYLNVWTTAPDAPSPMPVMVWIHGGGFAVGSGAEPRYDGGNLAARGVVVVTMNYRLNALGFLAHPELSAESAAGASGNYGLMDIVAALRWVSRNIGAFGGDPARVTVAGESAGSMAVSALMGSPSAKGLFAGAIGESGALFPSVGRAIDSLPVAHEAGVQFARRLGAASLAALRRVPANDILAAAPGIGFGPIVDGDVLPAPLAQIFAAGAQNDVPLLAGWNRDEGFNFNAYDIFKKRDGETSVADIVRRVFGAQAQEAHAFYPADTKQTETQSARRLGADAVIVQGTWAWLEAQKKTGAANIFRFQFDRAPLTPEGWFGSRSSADAGAFHAGELLYVFDNLDAFPWLVDDDDVKIAKLASSYWLNFIKTYDPNGEGLPHWPNYREDGAQLLAIDAPPSVRSDQDRARQQFLAARLGS